MFFAPYMKRVKILRFLVFKGGDSLTEREYILNLFYQHFTVFQNKKIALYGIGNYTKYLLEDKKIPRDFDIMGLLDGFCENGSMCGKPILSLKEVLIERPALIIIAARASTAKIIFQRIASSCKDYAVPIYDIYGTCLSKEEPSANRDHPCFHIQAADLQKQIVQHDIISFDIFDTLIMRKVLYPDDLFELVEIKSGISGFAEMRSCIQRKLSSCPSIHTIYDALQQAEGFSKEQCRQLKALELQAEMDLAVPRAAMAELFHFAVAQGKQVYLISDMYLPKDCIYSILGNCGIVGYKELIVSNEFHTDKTHQLFDILKDFGAKGAYLHIGDDEAADIRSAERNGIDAFPVGKAIDLLEASSYKNIRSGMDSFEKRMKTALLITRLFQDPFSLFQSNGKPQIDYPYDLGYCLLAPILTDFISWFIDAIRIGQYDTVLFLARDGYLLKQLYEDAIQQIEKNTGLPTAVYFLTSRTASMSASMFQKDDILYAASLPFQGSVEEILQKRFFLNKDECLSGLKPMDKTEYILLHKEKILEKSAVLRQGYRSYIESLNLQNKNKIALFDFVSTGTCQMCMEQLFDKKIDGFYFIRLEEEYEKKQKLSITPFYTMSDIYNRQNPIWQNYLLLENIIKAPEPSVLCYDQKGTPVFTEEMRPHNQVKEIQAIQDGIIAYSREYRKFCTTNNGYSGRDISEKILSMLNNKDTHFSGELTSHFLFKDEFTNRQMQAAF